MLMVFSKCLVLAAAILLRVVAANPQDVERRVQDPVCMQLARALPPGTVHDPILNILEYHRDLAHWASSSTQFANCSVRPRTAQDVATILRIVSSTQTPFAVKGGGHASNPGFSSTKGVHISMSLFSEVTYNAAAQIAVIGAGLIWDDVYAALAPHGVNVLGGRVTGVGVGGFTLGGGYSWKSNQYGLTVDSVVAFELVKPNGDIVNVTATSDPTLFSGLKGGMNNFGIVTRFTLKTYPQTMVWGGLITYTLPHIPDVADAVADFSTSVTDPKASIITTYNFLLGQPGISQILFYDAPTPPGGIFDKFLAINSFTKDVKTRDFLSLVKASPSNATYGQRAIFNTVSLTKYTPTVLKAILNETVFWGAHLSLRSGTFISYDVEPFLPNLFSHNTTPSAYPPNRSIGLSPLNIYYAWLDPRFDSEFHQAARETAANIRNVAIMDNQDVVGAAPYPNYAIFDTPLENMYGGGLDGLKSLKATIDPENVMGLAGGFRF